jgi:gliding motility-associated-like protein
MKKIPFLLSYLLFIGIGKANAQDFSNKGTDFWMGYGYHVSMSGNALGNANGGGSQEMILYFTSDKNATVTVEIPGVGYSQTYAVIANQVTVSNPLPKTGAQDSRVYTYGTINRGIHLTSDVPIVAYCHIYNTSISGATLLFPTNTLGKEYYSVNYTQSSNASLSNCFFFVIATEDNTLIEITPSAANLNGLAVGVPSTPIPLNKGEIYSVMGTTNGSIGTDLTGSRIRSISNNGSGGCKKIAVFSGAGKLSIGGSANGSADNTIAQAFPSVAWGKKYLTAPTGSQPNNFYRVCVTDPNTIVKLNGAVLPRASLVNNFYYQFKNGNATGTNPPVANLIESDIPVMVAQYCTTQGTENNPNFTGSGSNAIGGDPEMIYLSPVEQTINKITLYSASRYAIVQSYINVVIKNSGIPSFTVDGVSKTSLFVTHPQDANYSYATIPVVSGSHAVYSDLGFNAIAYGFGSAESYGYNAGTNVKDFSQTASFQNPYKRLDSAISCINTPFQFSIPLNFRPATIQWDYSAAPNLTPNVNSPVVTSPTPDSTPTINGQIIYYYSPKSSYQFTKSNTAAIRDTIKLYTTSSTPDGCGSTSQLYTIPVKVSELPTANFTTNSSGCVTDSVHFYDATITNSQGSVITGFWDYGDGSFDTAYNPVKKFAIAKDYTIRYRPITSYGCVGDTSIVQSYSLPPIAKFGYLDSCIGNNIQLIDSSSVPAGSIVKWYWDYGDGTYDTTITNTAKTKSYPIAGTYRVKLVVQNNTGCLSNPFMIPITIRSKPQTDFKLPTAVCLPVGTAVFSDLTSAINPMTITKWKWEFGDGGIDSIQNPSHNYAAIGSYSVKLTTTNNYGCSKDTIQVLSNIYAQAKAKINLTSAVCLRDSTAFSDMSDGLGNAIVKWNWRFGDGSSDTLQTLKHYYTKTGVDTVRLFVVTDKGCFSDTAVATTIVNQLPLAGFKTVAARNYCENRAIQFIDTAVDRSTSAAQLSRWYWEMGNSSVYNKTNGGYNSSFNETYASFGTYQVKMMVENNLGCKSDTVIKSIDIHALPQVGFILPEVCLADAAAVFNDTSSIKDASTIATYAWNFNAGSPAISPGPTLLTATTKNGSTKYNVVGNYQVSFKLTSNFGCDSTLSQSFTVNGSIPHANFVVLNNSNLCSNDSIRIYDSSYVDFGKVTKQDITWNLIGAPSATIIDDNNYFGKTYSTIYPNFQSPSTKVYQVKMVAHSGNSSVCASSITKIVTLHQSPKVQFTTLPGICKDTSSRQITQATELGNVPGTFVYSGSGVNSTGIFNPQSVAPGKYPIKYQYSTSFGCADSATQSTTVWPSPVAKWGVNQILCEKNDLIFTDSSVANYSNIAQRYWDYGNGTTAVLNASNLSFAKQYATGNTYNVSLRVMTDSGCRSAYNVQRLKVNYLPKLDFTLPEICLPDGRATFTNNSSILDNSEDLFSYRWNFGDPNDATSSTLRTPIHRYSSLGPLPVQLKITTKDQCIDSLTQQFNTIYPQPKAAFNINPADICLNQSIQFTDATVSTTGPINTWVWDLANGNKSGIQNPSKKFSDSGNFNIVLYTYDVKGCVSDTITKSITVNPYPILDLGPNMVVLEGGQTPIKPLKVYGSNLQYLWTPSMYLSSDTASVPISTPLGDVTYKLTLTGIGNCSVTDDIFIKLLLAPLVPNAFSPNKDGINDTWKIEYLESYPGATVDVFNRYGQKVFSSNGYTTQWDGTFNGVALPIGTYYYIINPKNGRATIQGSVTIIK